MKLVPVCSVCDKIRSAYAQHGLYMKNVHILLLAEHARKFVLVCSACDEIGSAYVQHAIKSFPRMLSIRML
jgi:hypothetical protein